MEDVLSAARGYIKRGWQPLPIRRGTKRPVYDGWQRFSCTTDEVARHFSDGVQVGLLLGAGDLVDVDIDCEEALRLAGAFLPPTGMRHGRAGAPDSHWWYLVENPGQTAKFAEPNGAMLVEYRAAGGQTVVPPSVHPPTGKPYTWSNSGQDLTPTRVPAEELRRRIARLASAALLVRSGWSGDDARTAVQRGDDTRFPPIVREWLGLVQPRKKVSAGDAKPYTRAVLEAADPHRALVELGCGRDERRSNCPIRQHETARDSFVIDPDPPFWHCHACGGGGDAIKLVSEVRGIGYAEARKWLGDRVGVPDPWDERKREGPRPPPDRSGEQVPLAAEPKQEDALVFLDLSKAEELETEWLWYPYIPLGELTTMGAMPGTGKSNFTRWLATQITRGVCLEKLTDSHEDWLKPRGPGGVHFVCQEDHILKVVLPRLRILGADLSLIRAIEHPKGLPISALHIDLIRKGWDRDGPPRLLILDPASSMIPGGVDANAQSDVKQTVTGPLQALAQDYNVAVLLVAHVNKRAPSSGMHIQSWIYGSVEWSGGARASLVALRHQHDDEDRRVRVFTAKANLGPEGRPFCYEVVHQGRHCDVAWHGITDDRVSELTQKPRRSEETEAQLARCMDWLRRKLAAGPVRAGKLKAAAAEEGFTRTCLRNACEGLDLVKMGGGVVTTWGLRFGR